MVYMGFDFDGDRVIQYKEVKDGVMFIYNCYF